MRLLKSSVVLRMLPTVVGVLLLYQMNDADGESSPTEETFGNTLHYQIKDGSLAMWFWHNADGSYTARTKNKGEDGKVEIVDRLGRWVIEGNKLCRYQEVPETARFCEPLVALNVGETAVSANGLFDITLTKGR